jgi:NAD(P)-dependent dehydrogenase (short-subunit alcohol dehydrogenase family)
MPTTTADEPRRTSRAGRRECPRHRVSDRRRPRRAGSGRRSRRHRRPERDDKLIADTGGSAVPARLDISDPSSIEAVRGPVADELGRVDILVNNAAIFEAATRDDLDFDLWQRIMAVNLNGPMLMCKAFLPLMRGQGWGRVINVASATVAIASPVSIAYRASKMGVIGFTRALSATFGDEGITINAMLPSLTRTAMTNGLPQAVVEATLNRQVIHRQAEAADIAGSVFLLASDEVG